MPRTRKSHLSDLKAKVAVEVIKAHKTTTRVTQMFGVHPTQVGLRPRRDPIAGDTEKDEPPSRSAS
jgi:hypothetical protein